MFEDRLQEMFKVAENGRNKWLELVEKYNIDYSAIAYIMPHNNVSINKISMKYYKDVLKEKHAQRLIVIVYDEKQIEELKEFDDDDITYVVITWDEMKDILKYNDITTFSSQYIVISFEYGSDYSAERLLGFNDIVIEELVCIGILGLPEYKEV